MNPQILLPSNLENVFFIKLIRSGCSLQLHAGQVAQLENCSAGRQVCDANRRCFKRCVAAPFVGGVGRCLLVFLLYSALIQMHNTFVVGIASRIVVRPSKV